MVKTTRDVHAWNAIKLYERNAHEHKRFIDYLDSSQYLNHCDSSLGGQVKISLQPLNKYQHDFARPLPSIIKFPVS